MGFKALIILGAMLSVVVISIAYVLETTGADMVRFSENQRVEAQVETVAQSLGQLSNNISTIALSLADVLSIHDSEIVIEKKLMSMLTNSNIKNMVAGGGFWPEPFVYDSERSKASVFIALNSDGTYRRIQDYNQANARPYHIEEWYAPTRLVKGSAYWSKAYIDPYTKESMVTCSVPIYVQDIFLGVVTIDVRLDELQTFLHESGDKLGGYFLMFDRGGRLMSYPHESIMKNQPLSPLPTFRDIASIAPDFSELALVLSTAMQTEFIELLNKPNLKDMVHRLVSSSPDIDLDYAYSVANELLPNESVFQRTERLFVHYLDNDIILDEASLVMARSLPSTNWILIGALPERLLIVETIKLKHDLFSSMAFVSLILILMVYVVIHVYLVRPMRRVRNALIEQADGAPFSPIDYNAQNELGILVGQFNQVSTNLVNARERAIEAARAKQVFLANMSHEIRTPMNGILGATALMQDEPMTQKQQEYIGVIAHSSRSLMSLINNVLDFSKLESNHLILESATFNLDAIGCYVRDLMLPTIQNKPDLKFEYVYPKNVPQYFIGDSLRIEQIILNLVSNALKFTETGLVKLEIQINQMPQDDLIGVVLSVSDTGIGISEDKYDLIFEEFQQADASTTRCFGGSGLGLAITKQLVLSMGGHISLRSELGVGTQFDVCLPLRMDHAVDLQQQQHIPASMEMAFNGMSCLLVEDNHINMMLFEKMLLKHGFKVEKATNGVEATQKATLYRFDIIFMDIQMPLMDGLEATCHIRMSENKNQETPIVAMTANVSKDDVWRCLSSGMQAHIGKPLKETDLFQVTARLLLCDAPLKKNH